jgi:voltage-dependent calcium channel N type alpha-1B
MWRAKLYAFVESPPFQYFIAACICLNVCVLASFHHGQTEGWTQFQKISDDIFLLIFAIECVLKLVAFTPFEYFKVSFSIDPRSLLLRS